MHAVILSRHDCREYDQIINVYSAVEGKIALLARGIKKPGAKNAALVEPGQVVQIAYVPGKELRYLTSVTGCFFSATHYTNLAVASYLQATLALLNTVIEPNHADTALFELLTDYVQIIGRPNAAASFISLWFVAQLCKIQGFAPELASCAWCGAVAGREFIFSFKQGGALCGSCSAKNHDDKTVLFLKPKTAALVRQVFGAAAEAITKTNSNPPIAEHLLVQRYLEYHLGRPITGLSYLADTLKV